MNFAKENKTVLISGGVAVLFIVWGFVPGIPYGAPALRDDLVAQMQTRYNDIGTIKGYGNEKLVLPGMEPQQGIPREDWVKARQDMIQKINDQQHKVDEDVRNDNARGRVTFEGPKDKPTPFPILPGIGTAQDQVLRGYLPDSGSMDTMPFKMAYGQQFRTWASLLATGAAPAGAATADEGDLYIPPKPDKLKQRFADQEAARIASLPPGAAPAGGLGGASSAQSQQAERDFDKQQVMNRAASLHMYVEPGAFQKRDLLNQDGPPDSRQIFEALIDTWIQGDVVKAILAVNNHGAPPTFDVGRAPIKRLTRIVVGNSAQNRYLNSAAQTGGGAGGGPATGNDTGLFVMATGGSAGAAGGGGAMVGPTVASGNANVADASKPQGLQLPATPNAIDYSLSMTGRSAGQTYDVVRLSVVMDLDPAALNKFLDQLYRQNMGYALVNFQQRTVDPLDRASNGYLYGDGPAIEVELQFECLFFRSWTVPLMPDAVRRTLGGV